MKKFFEKLFTINDLNGLSVGSIFFIEIIITTLQSLKIFSECIDCKTFSVNLTIYEKVEDDKINIEGGKANVIPFEVI